MARTTKQIMRELDSFFKPSRKVINQQKKQIQPFIRSQLKATNVAKQNAFSDITMDANRKGLVYGGLPIAEQARYVGERFLPERAKIRQAGVEARGALAQELAGLAKEKGLLAQQIKQTELDREAAERQARRAAAASQSSTSGIGDILNSLLNNQGKPQPSVQKRDDGGFNFTNAKGNPISAARYAQLNNTDVRDVLYDMGQSGDTYAQGVYNQLLQDPFFGTGNKKYDQKIYKAYSPLFWGVK